MMHNARRRSYDYSLDAVRLYTELRLIFATRILHSDVIGDRSTTKIGKQKVSAPLVPMQVIQVTESRRGVLVGTWSTLRELALRRFTITSFVIMSLAQTNKDKARASRIPLNVMNAA